MRGERLARFRSDGLHVEQDAGPWGVHGFAATDDPAQAGPVELVIFATKAYSLREAARAMRPLVGPETSVLPLLNGVDIAERVGAELEQLSGRLTGEQRATFVAERLAPALQRGEHGIVSRGLAVGDGERQSVDDRVGRPSALAGRLQSKEVTVGQVADMRSLIDSVDGIVIQQPISSTTNDASAVAWRADRIRSPVSR